MAVGECDLREAACEELLVLAAGGACSDKGVKLVRRRAS